MESGIIVYKKVVSGAGVDETIQRCLRPYEDRLRTHASREAIEIEEMLERHSESFLPDRFKRKGYNRLRSVFAFPFEFPDEWCYPNLVPADKSFSRRETIMKMVVDGNSALVLSMEEVEELYFHTYHPMEAIRAYWESAVLLKEFVRDFRNHHKNAYEAYSRIGTDLERVYEWYSKDGTKRIKKPEVIIPDWSLEKISFLNAPENYA